jgi:dTMP kinase
VLDATRSSTDISREIHERIRELLPDPVPLATEDNTGSIPVVRE